MKVVVKIGLYGVIFDFYINILNQFFFEGNEIKFYSFVVVKVFFVFNILKVNYIIN